MGTNSLWVGAEGNERALKVVIIASRDYFSEWEIEDMCQYVIADASETLADKLNEMGEQ